jgi:putative membrane protein
MHRSAQLETDRLADSSKILADLPHPKWSMLLILPVALLIGFFYSPWEGDAYPWYIEWPAYSIILYAVPAWGGAIISYGWLKLIGGNVYFYRTILLALVALLIIGLVQILGTLLDLIIDIDMSEWYLFVYSSIAMVIHLTILMTATRRWILALPATLAQSLLGLLTVLLLYYGLDYDWTGEEYRPIILIVIFLGTFIGLGHMALHLGTRPLSDIYGVKGPDVFRAFLEHWVQGGDAGRDEIEGFFRVFSEPAFAKAEVIAFREKGSRSPIATMVIPSLHPGPWGELGGSDMPRKFARAFKGDHGEVFTFHGASDHDLNPVDLEEVQKLSDHMKRALEGLDGWSDKASPLIRVDDGISTIAQAFNGAVMAAQTSAPSPTDDVDGAAGHVIDLEMERAGASPGAFIDCHNCLLPGVGHVPFGTPKARLIQERVGEATRKAIEAESSGYRVGVGRVPNDGEFCSMGPMGLQALVVEVGDQTMAWILADGNNMERYLRERVRDSVMEKVDEAEVLTTDNHIVNVSVGGFNPVGMKDDHEAIVAACNEVVHKALENMKEAESAAVRDEVGDVMVWGHGNTIRLSTTINAALATSKSAIVASMIVAFSIGMIVMWFA